MKNVSINIVVSTITFLLAALLITFGLRVIALQGIDLLSILSLGLAVVFVVVGVICIKGILKEKKNNPDAKLPASAKVVIILMAILTIIVAAIIAIFISILINPMNQLMFM